MSSTPVGAGVGVPVASGARLGVPVASGARRTIRLGPPTGGPADLISPAVRYGDLVFVSGQAGLKPGTMQMVSDEVTGQARACLDQLAAILTAAGTELAHVLHLECYLADASDFAAWNQVYAEYFPADPPARTTLVVGFAVPGMRIEVGAVAGMPASGGDMSPSGGEPGPGEVQV